MVANAEFVKEKWKYKILINDLEGKLILSLKKIIEVKNNHNIKFDKYDVLNVLVNELIIKIHLQSKISERFRCDVAS